MSTIWLSAWLLSFAGASGAPVTGTASSSAINAPLREQGVELTSDGMRCGDRLVTLGDTKGQVLGKCGEPTYSDSWTELRPYGNQHVTVRIDEWFYELGSGRFSRLLHFENNRLTQVKAVSP